jgi:hypothetical protein
MKVVTMKYSIYKNLQGLAYLLLALAISGCDNDNDSSSSENGNTGTFIDSPVANINYRTFSRSSVTNDAGEFTYSGREYIVFSIGDIDLPGVNATPIITPLDLARTDDVTDTVALNIVRLLMSLDADSNPDNGIQIGDQAKSVAQGMDVDFGSDSFEDDVAALVANSGSATTELVSAADAQQHLEASLDALISDRDGDGVGDNGDYAPDDANIQTICQSDASEEDKRVAGCDNTAPVAVITYEGATTVAANTDLSFDASNSYDPDAHAISYSWSLLSAPEGTVAELTALEGMSSGIIKMDLEGDYIIELTVSDGFTEDVVTLTITADKSLPSAGSMFGIGLAGIVLLSLFSGRNKKFIDG